MTIHDTYGTKTHTVKELAELLAPLLNLAFAEHDNYFRGEYLKAGSAPTCERSAPRHGRLPRNRRHPAWCRDGFSADPRR
jgi:hypothetical protein